MTTKPKHIHALYEHPDGLGELTFDVHARRLLVFNRSETMSTHVSIGPAGLRILACRLLSMAETVEAWHSSRPDDDDGNPFDGRFPF